MRVALRAAVKNVADGSERPGEPAIVGLVATCKREGWKPTLRTCLSKAKTSAALTACVPGPGPETKNGVRRSEAEITWEEYSFESDGTTFLARAVGDLDCDTNTAAFELRGSAADGTVFTRPPRAD